MENASQININFKTIVVTVAIFLHKIV